MKHQKFVVFLDVDGVLNTRTTVQRTPDGYKGIDYPRVEILSKAIYKYGGGDIILSSDWKKMKQTEDDYLYLASKLEMYGLFISGKTEDSKYDRGAGIVNYLNQHPEIEEYVILDDCIFDFQLYTKLWERLLITNGIENAKFAASTPAVEALIFMDYLLSNQKEKENAMNNRPGNPRYAVGDEVTFKFDQGHGVYELHRGMIGIVDAYGSLEFHMEQPSYDIWIKEDNGKDCLCKHVPEEDICGLYK